MFFLLSHCSPIEKSHEMVGCMVIFLTHLLTNYIPNHIPLCSDFQPHFDAQLSALCSHTRRSRRHSWIPQPEMTESWTFWRMRRFWRLSWAVFFGPWAPGWHPRSGENDDETSHGPLGYVREVPKKTLEKLGVPSTLDSTSFLPVCMVYGQHWTRPDWWHTAGKPRRMSWSVHAMWLATSLRLGSAWREWLCEGCRGKLGVPYICIKDDCTRNQSYR